MKTINIRVNGEAMSRPVDDRLSLADFIRDHCLLTGTHVGCEQGVCGACTLMLDGKPARSCITLAVAADGAEVRTVEGYDDDPLMRAIRTAFNRRHALQCGFCTPGMLATAYDILSRIRRTRPRPNSHRTGWQLLPVHWLSPDHPGDRRRVRAACAIGCVEAGHPSRGMNPGLQEGDRRERTHSVNRRQILAAGAGALGTGILPRAALRARRPVKVGVILYLSGVQPSWAADA